MADPATQEPAEPEAPAREQASAESHVDILRRGVEAWNQWRNNNPDITPDLKGVDCSHTDLRGANLRAANLPQADLTNSDLAGADLAGADLREAKLGGTKFENAKLREADLSAAELSWFRVEGADLTGAELPGIVFGETSLAGTRLQDADLRNADLSKVSNLQAGQLGGADLSGAKLPEDLEDFPGFATVEESSRNARKLFLSMQLVCAYTLLTAATTVDSALVTNSATSPLPIIGSRVPIVGFYWLMPVLLLGFYVYFHLYSQRLWEGLASMPAVFPDGRSLDKAAYPWLLNGLISAHRQRLRNHRPPLFGLQYLTSVFAAWCVVPLTILGLWLRFLTRQDLSGTAWHVAVEVAAVAVGLVFYGLAKTTLSGVNPTEPRRKVRLARWAAVSALVGGFGYFSYQATQGAYSGWVFTANFERQDVSTKLAGWGPDVAGSDLKRVVQGALLGGRNLRGAKAQGAFLARADLRGTDLSGADLQDAALRGAQFDESTNLNFADLRGADLTYATGLSQSALVLARGDDETQLPENEGLVAPFHWSAEVTESAEFVKIPKGTFQMGCVKGDEECEVDESPPHEVVITKPFLMQVTEVTVEQYERFDRERDRQMDTSEEVTSGREYLELELIEPINRSNPEWVRRLLPAVYVSWQDATAYCEWIGGRLPTEAEWEYAARGGKEGLKYPWGNEISHDKTNYGGERGGTTPVGGYEPNGYGLYDMAGNVWEWCSDWYGEDYYSEVTRSGTAEDPTGPSTGDYRVVRGGSWSYDAGVLRVSVRDWFRPEDRYGDLGFRCVREVIP